MRHAKTAEQHKIDGTFQPCRHGDLVSEDPIEDLFPACPSELTGKAKEHWYYIQNAMQHLGILRVTDAAALAAYCLLYGKFLENPNKFPMAGFTALRQMASELYLTPQSRARMPAAMLRKEQKPKSFADL